MEILNSIFYFIIVIGVLVFVHEWGHFIAAKLTGMRADVFSLGMGRRLFGYNKINGFTTGNLPEEWDGNGKTDYRISLLPIGGYVKIAGMIDESFDENFVGSEPKDYEFRSKGFFKKAFVLSAGVIMNFILAVILLGGISFFKGEQKVSTTTIGYVAENSVAENIGLKETDRILAVNDKAVDSWDDIIQSLQLQDINEDKSISIIRNGEKTNLNLPGKNVIDAIANKQGLGLIPENSKVVISVVESLEPAGEAGMEKNDTLISINGENILTPSQVADKVKNNDSLIVSVKRGQDILNLKMQPNRQDKIGVAMYSVFTGEYEKVEYNILESIVNGFDRTINLLEIIISSITEIFRGNIAVQDALGGPIVIAKQSAQTAEMGISSFLTFMSALSISLALMNILPIPALDGGHLLIVTIEAIYGKELPVKAKIIIQNIGVFILLILMVFIIIFDLLR